MLELPRYCQTTRDANPWVGTVSVKYPDGTRVLVDEDYKPREEIEHKAVNPGARAAVRCQCPSHVQLFDGCLIGPML